MRAPLRISWYRRFSQLAFFLISGHWLLIGFLRCPFGVPFVSCSTCPLGDCSGRFLFAPMVLLLAVTALAVGRAFCGWICPLGYLQDACAVVAQRRPVARSFPGWLARHDRILKGFKYVVLAAVVLLILRLNITDGRAHPYVIRSPDAANADAVLIGGRLGLWRYPVRAALLMGALIGALLIPRMWCRWFCPLGAALGILNRVVPFRLRRDRSRCCECGRYPKECIQYTMPGTTDCIVCGECAEGCPTGAIGLRGEAEAQGDRAPDEDPAPSAG